MCTLRTGEHMKTCYNCKQTLPISSFSKNRTKKGGHHNLCKNCDTNKRRDYRKTHPEQQKEAYRRPRKKIIEVLGNKCKICKIIISNSRMVFFHEINGKSHVPDVHYTLKHIKDFVPLCWKCHLGVHFCMRQLGLSWYEIIEMREIICVN
jgi:hypothetical protein